MPGSYAGRTATVDSLGENIICASPHPLSSPAAAPEPSRRAPAQGDENAGAATPKDDLVGALSPSHQLSLSAVSLPHHHPAPNDEQEPALAVSTAYRFDFSAVDPLPTLSAPPAADTDAAATESVASHALDDDTKMDEHDKGDGRARCVDSAVVASCNSDSQQDSTYNCMVSDSSTGDCDSENEPAGGYVNSDTGTSSRSLRKRKRDGNDGDNGDSGDGERQSKGKPGRKYDNRGGVWLSDLLGASIKASSAPQLFLSGFAEIALTRHQRAFGRFVCDVLELLESSDRSVSHPALFTDFSSNCALPSQPPNQSASSDTASNVVAQQLIDLGSRIQGSKAYGLAVAVEKCVLEMRLALGYEE